MRKWLMALAVLFLLAAFFLYVRWSSAIRQPFDFLHPAHVKERLSCERCHRPQDINSLPATSLCKECHTEKNLPIQAEWRRVYRVAPDIIFTHEKHQDSSCATCHKEMTRTSGWIHETRFAMNFCMDCHARERAPNQCRDCHKNR